MKFTAIIKLAALSFVLLACGSKQNEATAQEISSIKAKVTITEYSDYQCPACAYYHPIVDSLKKVYGDELEVEYKDFPLNSHQFAALAARAAEAAKKQGKFLEMHNILFENQQQWVSSGNPVVSIIGYARSLELDIEQFRSDLNAAETQQAVMEEKEEGVQAGVNSTPTFYINGEKIEQNPRTFDEFKVLVESYMRETN